MRYSSFESEIFKLFFKTKKLGFSRDICVPGPFNRLYYDKQISVASDILVEL